ncbi:hypothetical protein LGQ02_03940 [Bacillus shivajii]|nr:hypothetical protein [Bacillus shivajii]UCZ53944.1 hypothetical protein LGQ02_03940 [Bacillus shivajii]
MKSVFEKLKRKINEQNEFIKISIYVTGSFILVLMGYYSAKVLIHFFA